ncbi:MAG: hypothetical protein V3R47_05820, partial [candidate division NC10 bacterium]
PSGNETPDEGLTNLRDSRYKGKWFLSCGIQDRHPESCLPKELELIRRWTVCIVVCGFMAGLGLCLIADFHGNHHGEASPSTVTHIAQACGTSVVPCEDQSGSNRLLLASSLSTEDHTFQEGVSLPPPFPPPRG